MFVPKVPHNNIPALVQIMAWRRPGDKPLSEPMMVSLLTHICITRPQWVKIATNKAFLYRKKISPAVNLDGSMQRTRHICYNSEVTCLALTHWFQCHLCVFFCCPLSSCIGNCAKVPVIYVILSIITSHTSINIFVMYISVCKPWL